MTFSRTQSLTASIVVGVIAAISVLSLSGGLAQGRTAALVGMDPSVSPAAAAPSPAVLNMIKGANAVPPNGVGAPTPEAKLALARGMYRRGDLRTSSDYYLTGCLLASSKQPADVLLAHDLAITALSLGDSRSVPLITSSEDRYLLLTGRSQRYGTQRRKVNDGTSLAPIDSAITDIHRHVLKMPTLRDLQTNGDLGRPNGRAIPVKPMPMSMAANASSFD